MNFFLVEHSANKSCHEKTTPTASGVSAKTWRMLCFENNDMNMNIYGYTFIDNEDWRKNLKPPLQQNIFLKTFFERKISKYKCLYPLHI